ncbi:MAG: hypothetical protein ACRD2I_04860 [Vicinamibacterales bacterium]
MPTMRPVRQRRERLPKVPKQVDVPVLIVPRQDSEIIRQRRDIREAFHDSKALTITAKRR